MLESVYFVEEENRQYNMRKEKMTIRNNRAERRTLSGKLFRAGLSLALFFGLSFGAVAVPEAYPGETVYAETISGDDNEEIKVDPTGKGEGYSAVLYDNTNGLPTAESNAIAETSEGFIWIGCYSGLIRYDGNTFERIDSTTGVTSVVSLYVDSKDRLWIGTNDNGVALMEKGELRMFDDAEGLKSSSIRSIVEDPSGNIYIATTKGLGMIDSDLKLHAVDETQINEEYICELRITKYGMIYGETLSGAVFTMENGKVTGYYDGNKLGIGVITTVLPDPDNIGYVYLGTEESQLVYGKLDNGLKNKKVIGVAPLRYINSIEKFKDEVWICADNGIGFLQNGKFVKLENIPINNSIDHMLTDYEGNLWFTSSRQGVMKIVPNQFTDIYEWYGLPSAVVNSTCVLDNQIFIGTDTGLTVLGREEELKQFPVIRVNSSKEELKEFHDLKLLLEGCRIRSIIRDSKDRLWFSTFSDRGLVVYDHGVVTCITVDDGLPSNRVRTVCEKKDGTLMVAGGGGMALLKEEGEGFKVQESFTEQSGISNPEILTLVEADNGDMIMGSDGDGIYVISGHQVKHMGKEIGLGSEVVLRIKKDVSRDIYWVITSNSIAYMDADYKVNTIKKFPYSNNFDLYENNKGEMWILSSNGIYVCSVEDLLRNEELTPVFFDRNNGLSYVTTANSYSELTREGILYIAGNAGVVKVNIDDPLMGVNEIKMAVPFVDVDGTLIYATDGGTIRVPSDATRVTIHCFVYTYSLMNPQVTYSLEGFDQTTTTVKRSELEPVTYTNLDGGNYRFVMHLKDALGRGDKELAVTIVKEKAVYEKVWFRILVAALGVMLIAALVILYVRRKLAKLKKKEHENKVFIREMIEAFAKTIDMKDKYTNGHSTRVAEYTAMLTKALGYDEETVEKYYNIALLHDIGKIGVPPEVLNKPGKLTDEEFKIIKSHSSLGYRVLKDISIMPELAIGAGYHHERPDGKGYPKGLKGEEIPRVAQIIAVADTFDAMYSDRPYRKRMNFDKAVSIIKEVSGTQLEADVVEAFLKLVEQGEFRDPEDHGGGSMEDINNIHKKQQKDDPGQDKTGTEQTEAEKKTEEGAGNKG